MGLNSHYASGDGDPELEDALSKLCPPPLAASDVVGLRNFMDSITPPRKPGICELLLISLFSRSPLILYQDDGVLIGDIDIPVDEGVIVAHTYWPENASENETFPLVVNYHGNCPLLTNGATELRAIQGADSI